MLQSWYLLGPVTRFQVVGKHVPYEVAQQPVSAVRTSGEALNPVAEELKVVCVETVRVSQVKCQVPSNNSATYGARNYAATSPQLDSSSQLSPMMLPVSMNSSQSSRSCSVKSTSLSYRTVVASATKAGSTGRPWSTDIKSVYTANTPTHPFPNTTRRPSTPYATSTIFHSILQTRTSQMMVYSCISFPTAR